MTTGVRSTATAHPPDVGQPSPAEMSSRDGRSRRKSVGARVRIDSEERPTSAWLTILAKLRWTISAWIMERRLVDQNIASWNPLTSWLETVDALRRAA
jgi:hypothetical protein